MNVFLLLFWGWANEYAWIDATGGTRMMLARGVWRRFDLFIDLDLIDDMYA